MGAGGQGTKKDFLNTEIPKHISLLVGTSQGRRDPDEAEEEEELRVLRPQRSACPVVGTAVMPIPRWGN